jgi:hypothetical protein
MENQQARSKGVRKIFIFFTLTMLVVAVAFIGWLSSQSPFLAGTLFGLCIGIFFGFLLGSGMVVVFIAAFPDDFKRIFEERSAHN